MLLLVGGANHAHKRTMLTFENYSWALVLMLEQLFITHNFITPLPLMTTMKHQLTE